MLLGLTFFEGPRGVVISGLWALGFGLWALVDVRALGIAWAGRQNWDVVVTSDFFFPICLLNNHIILLRNAPERASRLFCLSDAILI